jgi:predicted Zn-dependent protease
MSPRLPFLAGLTLLAATAAFALDLGGLSKALNNTDKLKKGLDTAQDAAKVMKGIAGIGPEEELLIGESVSVEIVGQYGGLVRDDAILRRVNLVGRALARYSDRPGLNWCFGVLNSDSVNAFSSPGGFVFITRGLYALAETDDALAAILGHEIAHITGKHALKIVQRGEFLSGLGSQVVKRSGNTREIDAQLKQLDLGVTDIAKTLFEKGFDPQTEYAADKDGRQLALVTGYAPGGLRAVLIRLQSVPAGPQKIFSSHPSLIERIKRLPGESATAPAATAAAAGSPGTTTTSATPPATKAAAAELDDDDKAFADAAEKKPAKKKN